MAIRTLVKLFETANPLYANAIVSFYTVDANGAKTTTLATLYDADTGTGFVTNPATLTPEGKLPTPAYTSVAVIASIVAVTVDNHDTGVFYPMGGATGDWATATLYYPNDIFRAGALADASYDVYAVKARHTSGVFATDLAAGKLQKLVDVSDIASLLTLGTITPAWQTVTDDATIAIGLETIRTALAAKTAPAIDDEFLIRDTAGTTGKRMTFENQLKVLNGLTAETAPALADVVALYDNSAGAIRKMTPDNLLKVVNLLTEDTAPANSTDYLLEFDTSAGTVKRVKPSNVLADIPFRSYLAGLALSNDGSDASNDIDIAAGECIDSTNVSKISLSAIVKRLDANWAVGTNQGGLDTGAKGSSTWYHVWAIKRSDTGVSDVLFSASATAPTMPANYDRKRRIGAVKTDGSSNLLAFTQDGDDFYWATPVADVSSANPGTSAISQTLASIPLGVRVLAYLVAALRDSSTSNAANSQLYLSDLSNADVVPTSSILTTVDWASANGQVPAAGSTCRVYTNTSQQIRSRLTNSTANLTMNIAVLGWSDTRGRLA